MLKFPPAIFLMGPTASGKTDLALNLCERLPCDIVSVDSAMIYRDMNVGTAKPSAEELARAPHRLIDILDPAETYSAAQFREDALTEMTRIAEEGRIPLLVGGTMLYFRTLLQGMADLPEADPQLRRELTEEAMTAGWPALHERLATLDPEAARGIHPNNHQRLLRALEVVLKSGRPISRQWRETTPGHNTYGQGDARAALPYTVVQIALFPTDRSQLHEQISRRFAQMLDRGLVEEVKALRMRGDLHLDMPSMRCVGYRQVWEYLEGLYDRVELEARGAAATRQLAKRQLTWLRGWPDLSCIDPYEQNALTEALKIIEQLEKR